MLKRKALNKIFISTVVFFIVFVIYNLHLVNSKEIKETVHKEKETIYTINKDNYISKTEVYVGKVFTLQDKIKSKLETMTEENDKNSLLPSYFNPILPKNTKVLDVIVEDSLVKINFSKELNNITEKQSEKMIESIIYTITNEDILGIEIYVEGNMLKYVPHTKKELPTILTRKYGINKTYDLSSYDDITKLFLNYYMCDNNNYYEVPVTKYVNDKREKLEIIIEELSKVLPNSKLISLLDNKDYEYKIEDNSITINFNSDISKKESDIIISSLLNNYDIDKVQILINKVKKYETTKR